MKNTCRPDGKSILFNLLAIALLSLVLVGCAGDEKAVIKKNNGAIKADFGGEPTSGQSSLAVSFSDRSDLDKKAATYEWDFGDGTTSMEENPVHVYTAPGVYTVSLTLTTAKGLIVKTLPDYITVTPNDVLTWNNLALQAMAANNFMPPQGARALAMLHAAIYDSVNAIEPTGEVYQAAVAAPAGAVKEAAAAQAAHDILIQLFPAQAATFDAQLATSLGVIADGEGKTSGVAVGQNVAALILAWRTGDGSAMPMAPPYTGGTDPGDWRPTPPAYSPGMFVWWADVTPFALASANQFRPGPPPALDSVRYAADFNETRTIGAKVSATRTMDQGMMANFWVGMPGTIMEVGRMNQVVQQAAVAHNLGLSESARLFALVNIAMTDAAIAGVECKYYYSAWRPVTAIWEAAGDGNPATAADPAWESFIVAPAHPEYISTHSALINAAAEVLQNFFGSDDADLTLPAFMDPMMTRSYDSFSAVAEEAGLSRIYGGIHFRFSNEAGAQLGEDIGEYVFFNFMQPL